MSDSDSDITNYAYVWYKRKPVSLEESSTPAPMMMAAAAALPEELKDLTNFSQDELDKIHEIIMRYSYPCYLAGDSVSGFTPQEKDKLLNSELLFIREKMREANLAHIVIIQIPRILYDLFNLYYTSNRYYFDYSCSLKTLREFNEYTRRNTDSCKESIFMLNKHIIDYLNANKYLDHIESYYYHILIFLTRLPMGTEPEIERNRCTNVRYTITYDVAKSTRKISDGDFSQRLYLIGATLDIEKKKSQGRLTLYRAATLESDNVGRQSLSLNTSMLTGCKYDINTACTFNLSLQGSITSDEEYYYVEKKIIYNIKKFFVGDLSDEDSLFFIPPIHPFLQVYCGGELFHARTKLGIPYPQPHKHIRGLACSLTDYLKSDKYTGELETIYEGYKNSGEIYIWYLDNERRPAIRPALPPPPAAPAALPAPALPQPIPQPPALTFAQRFRALYTPAASQPTLPRPQPRPLTPHEKEVWDARLRYHRGGGKKKYFFKKRSLRKNKTKSRRKNKSRRNKSFKN